MTSIVDRATGEQRYPCAECGVLRTKAEGGTVFTVCDGCWDKRHPPRVQRCIGCGVKIVDNAAICEGCWDKRHSPIGAKLLSATREQLIEEVLRLRGELAEAQRRTAHAAKVILKGDTAL
jgi:hypothetical protein